MKTQRLAPAIALLIVTSAEAVTLSDAPWSVLGTLEVTATIRGKAARMTQRRLGSCTATFLATRDFALVCGSVTLDGIWEMTSRSRFKVNLNTSSVDAMLGQLARDFLMVRQRQPDAVNVIGTVPTLSGELKRNGTIGADLKIPAQIAFPHDPTRLGRLALRYRFSGNLN